MNVPREAIDAAEAKQIVDTQTLIRQRLGLAAQRQALIDLYLAGRAAGRADERDRIRHLAAVLGLICASGRPFADLIGDDTP